MIENGGYAADAFSAAIYRDNTIMPKEIKFEHTLEDPVQTNQYSREYAYRYKSGNAPFVTKDVRRYYKNEREL